MHLSGKWEEFFVAVTERSKNSGDKIPKKFKGETCSLREGVYGTFTAEQGKAQWPVTAFPVLYFYEKITLKFCLLMPQIKVVSSKKHDNESTVNVSAHGWLLQKKTQGTGKRKGALEVKALL